MTSTLLRRPPSQLHTTPSTRGKFQRTGSLVDEMNRIGRSGTWVATNGTIFRITSEALKDPGVEKHFALRGVELDGQCFLLLDEDPEAEVNDERRMVAFQHGIFLPQPVGTEVTDFSHAKTRGAWLQPETGTIIRIPKSARSDESAVKFETPLEHRYVLLSPYPDTAPELLKRIAQQFGLPLNF